MKIFDGRFEYRDDRFLFGSDCACHMRVWQHEDGRNVVIATEIEPSPGASVTNSCERWAAEVCRKYLLDPIKTIFIENYDRRHSEIDTSFPAETFDFVIFQWNGGLASKPEWKHCGRAAAEALIEDDLP